MGTRSFKRTLLIVCEGNITEPSYFIGLSSHAKAAGVYSNIEIYPSPEKSDGEETKGVKTTSKRRVREFSISTKPVSERAIEPADSVERKYASIDKGGKEKWPNPINYVKEARDKIKSMDGAYNDVWVVFDKDGHPKISEAFELAANPIKDIIVNVAFSSIAFEHWLLLHFERNKNDFRKSECKESTNGKKRPLDCGTGVHDDDCQGDKCVIGYLRSRDHLRSYNKSHCNNIFTETESHLPQALINAAWLRYIQQTTPDSKNLHELNPITTIDLLVRVMLGKDDEKVYFVAYGNSITLLETIELYVEKVDMKLKIAITNLMDKTILCSEFTVSFDRTRGNLRDISGQMQINQMVFETSSDIPRDTESISLEFRKNIVFFTDEIPN